MGRAPKGKIVRKSMALRQMAVMVAIIASVLHMPRTKLWNAIPDEAGWNDAQSSIKMRKDKFIKFWADRFYEEGNLLDHHPHRISKGMSKEDALNAAVWLKTGYWVQVQGRGAGHTRYVHRWYPSVSRACRKCPQLRAIRDKYGLTNKRLLYWMKKYDPALARRSVYYKYGYSDELLSIRQMRGTSLYKRATTDPTFLDRCYYIDECTIWLDNEIKKGVRIYCDAHDLGVHSVLHYDKLQEDKAIKVHFIAVVNAVHGAVYFEFTTGTDDIERKHNLKPNDPAHGPYMVSLCRCYFGKITVLCHLSYDSLDSGSIPAST